MQKTRKELSDAFIGITREVNILALEDFACCQSCGYASIENAMDDYHDETGKTPIGFVFYHAQDKENLDNLGWCYLSFGARSDENDASIAMMIKVFLIKNGFDVEWNGDVNKRILVKNVAIERK